MRYTLFFVVFIFLFILASCNDKNKSVYAGCCGTEAMEDSIDRIIKEYNDQGIKVDSLVKARVYISNIFTPDSVYYENYIFPIFGVYVNKVVSAKYFSESGETLFEHYDFQPNDGSAAWRGKKFNGDFFYGSFDYEVVVEFFKGGGERKTYTGRACSYKCGADGFPTENLPKCLFPSQNNGYSGFNPGRPIPNECF